MKVKRENYMKYYVLFSAIVFTTISLAMRNPEQERQSLLEHYKIEFYRLKTEELKARKKAREATEAAKDKKILLQVPESVGEVKLSKIPRPKL